MGNCCRCRRKLKRKIILLLVGLDNAGKTVAVKGLAGENPNGSIPTVGFSVVNLNYLNYDVIIYDLGGGSGIRGIWHRYFVDAHGVIFVVDASDSGRFDEVKLVLEELLSHEKISGKPLLILANKQDNKEALDEIDLVEKLGLENLVNEKKCPTLVESCSAKEINRGNKLDPGIENGYRWLLNFIVNDYDNLNERVEHDVQIQKEIEDKQRQQKIERLKMSSETETTEVTEIKSDSQESPSDIIHVKSNGFVISPSHSIKSTSSCVFIDKTNDFKNLLDVNRPKSAVQIVKNQLENSNRRSPFLNFSSNNKTAPITLLSPKSAPIKRPEPNDYETNFRSASHTGQILTVTELPNAIVDANGDNIGDLFELNNFSSNKRLPPIRQKSVDEYNINWVQKPLRNSVNVIQTNIDEIYKDIS